jgi:hypothetical protein
MKRFRKVAQKIHKRFFSAMTKDQADILASVKFPCC